MLKIHYRFLKCGDWLNSSQAKMEGEGERYCQRLSQVMCSIRCIQAPSISDTSDNMHSVDCVGEWRDTLDVVVKNGDGNMLR